MGARELLGPRRGGRGCSAGRPLGGTPTLHLPLRLSPSPGRGRAPTGSSVGRREGKAVWSAGPQKWLALERASAPCPPRGGPQRAHLSRPQSPFSPIRCQGLWIPRYLGPSSWPVAGRACWPCALSSHSLRTSFLGVTPPLSVLFQVIEVGHFWGYRIDEKNSEILKRLTAEINRLKLVPLPVHPHPDLVCLAPFVDFDKQSYFRAQILYVSGNSAEVHSSVTSFKGK